MDDVDKVRAHVRATIGEDSSQWTRWQGGWKDDIESALVDAVFSARAIYRSAHDRGVHAHVARWRKERTRNTYSLGALIAEFGAVGVSGWADRFGNHQVSPRRKNGRRGRSKAATVWEAAEDLRDAGINVASDITEGNAADVWRVLCGVSGIGYATANYFLILLGVPGIKPDRMIHRFLKCAGGRKFTNAYAERVLLEVARQLGVQPHELDHAIWGYESERARRRKRGG